MDRRYPIGRYEHEGEVPLSLREKWISEIEELPIRLKEAVKDLTEEQLNLEYREGGWRLRQVVHHIADSHMNAFIRFKLALTEDAPTIKPYLEEKWAELWDSADADIDVSITLLEALHKRWVILLRTMTDADYAKKFYHPESQRMIELDYNVGLYAWHGKHHVAHITTLRNIVGI